MHARADHHPEPLVEEEGDVVRVEPVDREGEDARPPGRVARAEDVDPGLALEFRGDELVRAAGGGADLVEADAR